jgi:hypothetical protein
VLRERKVEYRALNRKGHQLCRAKVDGCLITDQETAICEYLVLDCDDLRAYLIELKGKDIIHAVEQLLSTYQRLPWRKENVVFARAVVSRVPQPEAVLNDARVLTLRRLLKKSGGDFQVKSQVYEESL